MGFSRLITLITLSLLFFLPTVVVAEDLIVENTPVEQYPRIERVVFPDKVTYTPPKDAKDNYVGDPQGYSADGMSYHDDSLDIRVHKIRAYDTSVWVAYIQIADAEQFRTEQAKPYPSKATVKIDRLSQRVNAILAVNGDWCTYHNEGIIYRNGEVLREHSSKKHGLIVDGNGDLHIMTTMNRKEYAAFPTGVMHSFLFGPGLVMNGELMEIDRDVTYRERVAIGQMAPLCYVLIATDGEDDANSKGLSIQQVAQLMYDLGAHTAYNMDGGKSTAMMFNMIKLTGDSPEPRRAIGDIIYFTTAIPNK